jgi:exonuclease VII small subunit
MKRIRILDFRFWITRPHAPRQSFNPKSRIQNLKSLTAASALLLALAPIAPVSGAAKPTPTPTPTPQSRKLTGGFGRGGPDAVVRPAVPETTPAAGQSLADAVRAAGATKKRGAAKGKVVITNESLVTDPTKGRLTTSSPRITPQRVSDGGGLTPTPALAEQEAEAYWRDRMHSARARVEELEESVRRFEQESKKLENDFYSWDDGNYRDGVIKPAWDRKREELETARRDLEQARKELADLPEKGRRAGALPGWLRE